MTRRRRHRIGTRWRTSFNPLPWLRVNLSKTGISLSPHVGRWLTWNSQTEMLTFHPIRRLPSLTIWTGRRTPGQEDTDT